MAERAEMLGLLTAAVVAAAIALGGAFEPGQRMMMGCAIALVAGAALVTSGRRPAAEQWLALSVIGWGAVSAVVATGYPFAAKQTLGGWLVAWLVWLIAGQAPTSARRLIAMLVAVVAAVVAAAVLAECVGAARLRMGGLFVNPNVAAAVLVPALPLVAGLRGSGRWRGANAAALLLMAAGVLMTGSRAGVLALVVVVGLMLPRGRVRTVGLTTVLVVASGLLVWRFVGRPDSLAWHRIEIWRALGRLVVESPLVGVGPGWLEDATGVVRIAHEGGTARWGHVIGSAESTPFGLMVRTGVVGLGLAAAAALVWWRRRSGSEQSATDATSRAVLVGMALIALFHDFLDVDVVLWWWALLAGVATATVDPPDGILDRSGPVARLAVGLGVAFTILWTISTPALARWIWQGEASSTGLAERAERADPWFAAPVEWRVGRLLDQPSWSWESAASAIGWCRRSVELHPGSAGTWARLGDVHAKVTAALGPWPDALAGAREGYERATALEPHLPWYWLRWAAFERSVGRLEEARELAERAVSEEPNFVRGWLFCARLELDLGRREAARRAFERARNAAGAVVGRNLSEYEWDLRAAPPWQVRELGRLLAEAPAAERLRDQP